MKTIGLTITKNMYSVREHIGMSKAANNYDIFDAETDEMVLECREQPLDLLNATLRLARLSGFNPFHIHINTPDGEKLAAIRRHPEFLKEKIGILDGEGKLLWTMRETGNKESIILEVTDSYQTVLYTIRKEDKNYILAENRQDIGSVVKEWSELGKELFTSTDNYTIYIEPHIPKDSSVRMLILTSAICIDMLYYE
jgi:uncharacterized protein YxjI